MLLRDRLANANLVRPKPPICRGASPIQRFHNRRRRDLRLGRLRLLFHGLGLNLLFLGGGLANIFRHERPDLVQIDSGFVKLILLVVEVADTFLTEVTGMTDKRRDLTKKGVLTISRS